MLLVEQNATMALSIANARLRAGDRPGRPATGRPPSCSTTSDIQEFYLGIGEAGRRSFRDVKSYRRKKRWARDS